MIRKISFQNYKAFKKGEIKLKPITVLLGSNSVGKSSIINLLLMLQQTANSTNYKSALRLHGENVSMGECENIFRNKETDKNIVIDFEFKDENLKELLLKGLFNDFIYRAFRPIQFLYQFPDEEIKKVIDFDIHQLINKRREIDEKIYHSKEAFLKLISTLETLNQNIEKNRQQSDVIRYYAKRGLGKNLNDLETLKIMYDFLTELKKIQDEVFNLSFDVRYIKLYEGTEKEENVIKMDRVSLITKERNILNIKFHLSNNNTSYEDIKITSDFANGKELLDLNAKNELLKLVNFNSTIFSWVPRYSNDRDFFFNPFDDEEKTIITHTMILIIEQFIVSVKNQFARELVNHVSPLRANPKRYYFLDKANINTFLDTFDGNSVTEILKENAIVKKKVNDWLKNFGLEVKVSTFQDVIHTIKIHQHSLDLDITDVGFGVSQILPVIVQVFLSFHDSLTMIEQPETHLHPKMQADLMDLFIKVVKDSTSYRGGKSEPVKKHFLIETHSEYLLRRLRRRISEGEISAQDVAIYFIVPPKDKDSSAEIHPKEVFESGYFDYPKDFMDENLEKDMISFINQQLNK